MATGYSKLDCGIIHSTIWSEPHDVRVTWITLLAVTDATGVVRMAVPALAKLVDVTIERMEEILELLHSPDKYSRTKEHDGRRLETIDGGWRILNYLKYREGLRQPDHTATERKRRQREREGCHASTVTERDSHSSSRSVTANHAYAEAEAEAKADACKNQTPIHTPPPTAVADCGAPSSKEAKPAKPPQPKRDPLENLPRLKAAYPKIIAGILKIHPKAVVPKQDSKQEHDSKAVLSQLVRLDKFTEKDIAETLHWVLFEEAPSSGFTWREQFRSIAQLREVKGGATKFQKMFDARRKALGVVDSFGQVDPMVAEGRRQRALGLLRPMGADVQ